MSNARGFKSTLALDFETTYGSDPTSVNGIKMPIHSTKIEEKQPFVEDKVLSGRRDAAAPSLDYIDVGGPIVVPMSILEAGYWLKAMFGNPTTSGASPYTHVFKVGDSQPSLVLEQGYPDVPFYEKFNGCKVSKFTLPWGGSGDVEATIDIVGAKRTTGTTVYDSTLTVPTLTKFQQFQVAIMEGATLASLATAISGNIVIDFGLDTDGYAAGTSGVRGQLDEGKVKVTVSLQAFFKDAALLNKAINSTETSFKATWTSGANSLEILVPEMLYEKTSPGITGDKGIRIDLNGTAYYKDHSDNSIIKATLVNTQSTY